MRFSMGRGMRKAHQGSRGPSSKVPSLAGLRTPSAFEAFVAAPTGTATHSRLTNIVGVATAQLEDSRTRML